MIDIYSTFLFHSLHTFSQLLSYIKRFSKSFAEIFSGFQNEKINHRKVF